jgi:hypothetical protein
MARCRAFLPLLLTVALLACRPLLQETGPTLTPSPGGPSIFSERPTATPLRDPFYPLATRTGVASIDRVLDIVDAGDATALAGLIHYFPLPCTPPGGLGDVACPGGRPAGTGVDVVGVNQCGGSYLPRSADPGLLVAQQFLTPPSGSSGFDARLYAIVKRPLFGTAPLIPGDVLIVFAAGQALYVDKYGVTYFQLVCQPPQVAQEVLKVVELVPGPNDFLLPPR